MSDHNSIDQAQVPQASELPNAQTYNLPPVVGSETIKNSLQRVGQYVRDALTSITGNRTPRNMSDIMEHMYPGRGKDLEMEQSRNVGDCYFVAALYGLKHNEIFEHLMRKMVKKDGENWIVQFPDGSSPIAITPDDLSGQQTPHKKTGEPVHRKPVKGGAGDIVLERAYGRHLKDKKKKEYAKAYEEERTYMVLDGGYPTEVFEAFLNHFASHEMIFNRRQRTISEDKNDVTRVEQWLNAAALNPDYIIMAASTPSDMLTPYSREVGGREFSDDKRWMYFMDKEHFFYQKHAYTITVVDAEKRLVTVVNPHDTKKLKKIVSYDDFMKIFSDVYATKLQPNAIREELGVKLPAWKGPEQGFYSHSEQEKGVEIRFWVDVEDALRMLADAHELTTGMRKTLYDLTPQELIRITQKYSTIVTTAKFGGRNDPSEVKFAQEVMDYIEGIEGQKRQALEDEKVVYVEIDRE